MLREIKKYMYVFPEEMSYHDRQVMVDNIEKEFDDVLVVNKGSRIVLESPCEKYQLRKLIQKHESKKR